MFARNMWRIEINVLYKRNVCKVGHLPEETHYINYCEILRKVIKDAKKQHYSRLRAKPNNKIKNKKQKKKRVT